VNITTEPAVIRVDSAEEQYAYLTATLGAPANWEVISQTWSSLESGEPIELATLRLRSGDTITVRFGAVFEDDDSFGGSPENDEHPSTGWLDDVMEKAVKFSEANPPHHPGTVARFPVPAAGYANALSVPMGLIAHDGLQPALYAPPRIVAVNKDDLEPIGVGEFPGFDPEFWPPQRLSDWPLPSLRGVAPEQLQGMIERFSACWSRVIAAWFANDPGAHPFLADDIRAAQEYRALLDPVSMELYTERMNPAFAKWVRDNAGTSDRLSGGR
jgi:hypothetical protein